jgi:hypothetical protein
MIALFGTCLSAKVSHGVAVESFLITCSTSLSGIIECRVLVYYYEIEETQFETPAWITRSFSEAASYDQKLRTSACQSE